MKRIKKGDKITVLVGKDKGKTGNVDRVEAKAGKIFVSGINLYKRHVRRQGQIEGGVIDIIKPLKLSNVGLVCPKCAKTIRVGFEINGDKKVRVCRKCQEAI